MENYDSIMLSKEELEFLKETFYVQALEMTEQLTAEILALESNGYKKDSIKGVKRFFHTLKGDSSTIGLKEVAEVIHRAEDIMGGLEERGAGFNAGVVDTILKVVDEITRAIKANHAGTPYEISKALKEELERLAGRADKMPAAGLTEYEELLAAGCVADGKTLYQIKFTFSEECRMRSAGALLLSRHLPKGGELVRVEPEIESPDIEAVDFITGIIASRKGPEDLKKLYLIPGVIAGVTVEKIDLAELKKARGKSPEASGDAGAGAAKKETAQTIRVVSERIDQVMDLVGELVLGRSMIEQLVSKFESRYPKDDLVQNFLKANSFIGRSLSDLQRSVMSMRMVPIEKVFKKFPRMVRDICRVNAKEINLVLKGENTEVDKALIDVVGEPLLHIIRNAADHGIELPAEREEAGKKRTGAITVEAYHQDSSIVVRITDDGRGMDPAALKEKAVQKGLVTGEEAARMDERDAMGLIFLPGFSTAKAVSDISGRGIGMDIVKEVVEAMRGSISVKSQPGTGTAFTLKFPMTLSIIRAILVKIDGRLYALPLSSVVEITRNFQKDLDFVAGSEVLRYRNRVYPVIRMKGAHDKPLAGKGKNGKFFALILNHGDTEAVLVVDRLAGEKELVVKSVDERWVSTHTVSGASILGDGSVVLILNVAVVIAKASGADEGFRYGRAAS